MRTQKAIIFDSSSLISLVMNGLFPEFKELKKIFNGKFLITESVKKEIIDKPLTIKKFKLEALKNKELLDTKILEMPSSLSLNLSSEKILKQANEIMKIANSTFHGRGKDISLLSLGETSCLALSKILDEKAIKNVIAIDERTTRMLAERPENLHELLEKRLHTKLDYKKSNFQFFKGFKFIRSAELMYVAYKKKLIRLKNHEVLDALLYAVKFKGCAISGDEIREIKRIG